MVKIDQTHQIHPQEAMQRLAAARADPGAASGKMGSRATDEEIRMYVAGGLS